MTDNVEKFYPKDAAKDPNFVLEQAVGELSEVLIIGICKECNEVDVRSSTNIEHAGRILWLMEVAKDIVLRNGYIPPNSDGEEK